MPRKTALLIFFMAGLSALIYEITWVRQAMLTFGVSVYAYSAVLMAYMGGMALGGYAIGKWADRTKHPGRLFAVLQVGLAVLGLAALPFLNGLTGLYSNLTRSLNLDNELVLTILRLGLALLPLTPPALFIGAAFPVMARIYARADGKVGGDLGGMYAVNTLGSVVGCLLAAVVLIRAFGVTGTLFVAAALNLLTAFLAWFTEGHPLLKPGDHKNQESSTPTTGTPHLKQSESDEVGIHHLKQSETDKVGTLPSKALRFVIIAFTISGFVSLAYEVTWGRMIAMYVIGTVYSFSLMLAVYLTGLVVGAMLASAWIRRRGASLALFGWLEMGIGLLAVLSLFVFPRLSGLKINALFGGYNMGTGILYESLLSFITLFPVTVAIGAVFPVAVSLYSSEHAAKVGFKISRIAALNTVGSILGSLLAGFVIIPWLGLQHTVIALAAINVALGLAAVWFIPPKTLRRRAFTAVPVVLAVICILLLPAPRYLGYWEDIAKQLLFYKEGVETTVAVFDYGLNNPKFSTVNGRIEVPTDPVSMRIFHLLGHLPPLLKPDAKNALVLSFGNGIASGTMATHPVSSIDVVDLSAEMIEAAREVYSVENRGVVDDPRVVVHIEDARNYLLQTARTFDIISNDATHPSNSSSWVLYTAEFYRQVKAHLTPDGVFVQWLPCHSLSIAEYKMILRTFQSVFSNTTLWYTGGTHTMLLATPTLLTRKAFEAQLQSGVLTPEVESELGNVSRITSYWAFGADMLREFTGPGPVAKDDNAFYVSDGRDTEALIKLLQRAVRQVNP
ncbi:MAG: fused MFS/spermidine synthase [Spirochaetales bacterium]|nr:fused MFS/spermidine synthase [Spirochaetales bacterium]